MPPPWRVPVRKWPNVMPDSSRVKNWSRSTPSLAELPLKSRPALLPVAVMTTAEGSESLIVNNTWAELRKLAANENKAANENTMDILFMTGGFICSNNRHLIKIVNFKMSIKK